MANNATQEYVLPNNSQATQEYVLPNNSQATQEYTSPNQLYQFGNSQELPMGIEPLNRMAGQSLTPGANLNHEARLRDLEFRRQYLPRMSGVAPPPNFFRGVFRPRALTPKQAHQRNLNMRAYNARHPSATPSLAPAPKKRESAKNTRSFTTSWSGPFKNVTKNENKNKKKKKNKTKKGKSY